MGIEGFSGDPVFGLEGFAQIFLVIFNIHDV
jgi:hypothetical protein